MLFILLDFKVNNISLRNSNTVYPFHAMLYSEQLNIFTNRSFYNLFLKYECHSFFFVSSRQTIHFFSKYCLVINHVFSDLPYILYQKKAFKSRSLLGNLLNILFKMLNNRIIFENKFPYVCRHFR
jgi:hypothetical protein